MRVGNIIKVLNPHGADWLEKGKCYKVREMSWSQDVILCNLDDSDILYNGLSQNRYWAYSSKDFEYVNKQSNEYEIY